MKRIFTILIRRDMRKVFNVRTLFIWSAMSMMAVFFFFATSGKTSLLENNKVEFLALFLAQVIFGAWAVLSIYFDLISSDREQNVLDCILCAGISKPVIFLCKTNAILLTSIILSFIYLAPVTAVIVFLSGNSAHFAVLIQYLAPLWGYIMVYAALGMMISVVARSTKIALITCLACGLVLMPRFFLLIVDGLGNVFHWSKATIETISLIAPGVMMESLAHYAGTIEYLKMTLVFLASITLLVAFAYFTFCKQDELNYSE